MDAILNFRLLSGVFEVYYALINSSGLASVLHNGTPVYVNYDENYGSSFFLKAADGDTIEVYAVTNSVGFVGKSIYTVTSSSITVVESNITTTITAL